jgi:putative spermidine/putrescine transport system ATP-binding protein
MVRLEEVRKTYRMGETEVHALAGVSLSIPTGGFWAIMGPSGSGKSTMLNLLGCLDRPTSGSYHLNGRDVSRLEDDALSDIRLSELGFVFQSFNLIPQLTVQENIELPLYYQGWEASRSAERAAELAEMVNLGDRLQHRPSELSGGQQQRVAIARALAIRPKVLLLDEPLSALDAQIRRSMVEELARLHRDLPHLAVLYVTHDQSEALTMSNRIAVFDDGIIQQCDAPDVIYEKPNNAFVADFIGENNRMTGEVTEDNGDTVKVAIDNDQGTVTAKKVNVEGVGVRSTLSLRPERVTVNPEAGSLPNVFSGVAEELIYLGDHIRTRFTVCGHDDFIVKIPNSAEHAHLKAGDSVNIGWNAEDCRALDPSD